MIIDIHGHLGNINFSKFWQADIDKLAQLAMESNIDKICLSSSKAIMYDIHDGNMELNNALSSSDKFYGYVVISPTFPESLEDLSLIKSNNKFRGVKIHPDYHGYNLATPSNRDFIEKIADSVPMMLFHVSCMPGTGFSMAQTVYEIAKNHPNTKFVMAHCAGLYQNSNYPFFPNLDSLENIAYQGLPNNVWIDTAHFLIYVYPDVLAKMVRLVGAEHIVFGTDVPLQSSMQMRFAIEAVNSLDISEQEKELIFCGNAKNILSLK